MREEGKNILRTRSRRWIIETLLILGYICCSHFSIHYLTKIKHKVNVADNVVAEANIGWWNVELKVRWFLLPEFKTQF